MKIANFIPETVVDGPGIRAVLFVQGCIHGCEGCMNPQTWEFAGGKEMSLSQVIRMIEKGISPLHTGLTFSGGEPMLQAASLVKIAEYFGIPLVVYTGFVFEKLLESGRPGVRELLARTEILIDGNFDAAQRDLTLVFRGSRNQRLIDVQASLRVGKTIIWASPAS